MGHFNDLLIGGHSDGAEADVDHGLNRHLVQPLFYHSLLRLVTAGQCGFVLGHEWSDEEQWSVFRQGKLLDFCNSVELEFEDRVEDDAADERRDTG